MATEGWQKVRLGDLISIKHGWAFKGEFFEDYSPGKPIVVNIGNFKYTGGFRFEGTTLKAYAADYPKEYILAPGDILLVMTCQTAGGEILGIPGRIPNDGRTYLHNQRMGKPIIIAPDRIDKDFLYWLFLSPAFNRELFLSASGTKILHTAPSRMEAFQFILPPLNEQKAIVHILGTLDDKIELNQQMKQTLEGIARAIFKSWFIDFDPIRAKMDGRQPAGMDAETAALFPDEFEDSVIGQTPKGWRVGKLKNIADVVMGASPKGDTYNEDGIGTPLVNGPVEFGDYFLTKRKWTTSPTRLSQPGDLIFCVRGSTTGRRVISDDVYCLGRGVCAIRGLGNTQLFVNQIIEFELDRLLAKATGSVFPNLSSSDLREFDILVPPKSIIEKYCAAIQSLVRKSWANIYESSALASILDVLLPKLLSGEIQLKLAEKMMEGVV